MFVCNCVQNFVCLTVSSNAILSYPVIICLISFNREAIEQMKLRKNVTVTASTGMACMQFKSGQTIHKWTGIGDSHLSRNVIIQKIMTDATYVSTKKGIQECKVLFIDEIGMMSSQILGNAEYICRNVRQNGKVFGGLQIVASGCFRQLPPVPSHCDAGEYCFKHPLFDNIFPHRFNLTEVKRQNEHELIKCINELSIGLPSDETKTFIRGLSRPLPRTMMPTYIFGTNFDCDFFNDYKLEKHERGGAKAKIFRAFDDGPNNLLRLTSAPKSLKLKINCKVIITRNLVNGLVNGLESTVIQMHDNKVRVRVRRDDNLKHHLEGKEFDIVRYAFVHRNHLNEVKAVRTQFPLKLGYAITVDKSQGRTLSAVVIDAYNFWRPGQLSVSLSRARGKDFIEVMNYNTYACELKHPESVENYYTKDGVQTKADMSCCERDFYESQYEDNFVQLPLSMMSGNVWEDERNVLTKNITFRPFPWNAREFLLSLCKSQVTETQKQKHKLLMDLSDSNEMLWFLGKHYSFIDVLIEDYSGSSKGSKCNLCFLSAHLHRYFTSEIYIEACQRALRCDKLSALGNYVCTDICFAILHKLCEEKSLLQKEALMDEVM